MDLEPDIWVVLWSATQRAVHIDTVQKMLESNRAAFNERRRTDYIVMAVTNSREKAEEIADDLKRRRDEPPDLRIV